MGRDQTKKRDPRGPHIRLYANLYDSPAWRALSFSAQALWLAMRRDLNGGNNGRITATADRLKHRGFNSPATISKGLRELEVAGFIAKVRQGGIAGGGKVTSRWRFTDEAVMQADGDVRVPPLPTKDWQAWKKATDVERAISERHAQAKRPMSSGKSKLQKVKRCASKAESDEGRSASASELTPARSPSNNESERTERQHSGSVQFLAIRPIR